MTPRILQVRQRILKRNDEIARDLRTRFSAAGVYVVNLVSSPGAGKTELLARTIQRLTPEYRCAAVVGDLATENDANRLRATGAPARQIQTENVCHLEAPMVVDAVAEMDLPALDFLFIENVGNLVCPATWDLGENLRVLLLSVTEGEDKPLKYPTLINTADWVVLSKLDLARAVEFDLSRARANISEVRPGARVFELSARSGAGVDDWIGALRAQLGAQLRAKQ